MGKIDYKKLYKLQDIILDRIFEKDTEFYLTGGTCLNRFYYEKRYSDDLDFFTNNSSTFHYSILEILERFVNLNYKKTVESKDFVRILIDKDYTKLQIEFINDRVKKFGKFNLYKNYKLDNPKNILSNKLTAVLGRDNPKDVFDIYLISKNISFEWKEILDQAKEKLIFNIDDLIYRLETFPISFLDNIKTIDKNFLLSFTNEFKIIINEIKEKSYHSNK